GFRRFAVGARGRRLGFGASRGGGRPQEFLHHGLLDHRLGTGARERPGLGEDLRDLRLSQLRERGAQRIGEFGSLGHNDYCFPRLRLAGALSPASVASSSPTGRPAFSSRRSSRSRRLWFSCSSCFASELSEESVSHQLIPISRARSTEAISSRSLIVRSSMSSRLIWMSPAIT